MRDPQHTGDARGERLPMPLGLAAQVRLEDAVLSSPAVVEGLAYVVDQMGTAYCVDPDTGTIVWRSAPEGASAFGSNTSSPCVAGGRVYYGTVAGNLHVLSAADGRPIGSVRLGAPILSAVTWANDSVYCQTLRAVVYCLDMDGRIRWRWEQDGASRQGSSSASGGVDAEKARTSHYGGAPVAVAGDRVVAAVAYDLVCLEDRATEARLLWRRGWHSGNAHTPWGSAAGDGFVYCGWPGKDGYGAVVRHRLRDGSFDRQLDVLSNQWAVPATPAIRDGTAYFGRQAHGLTAYAFGGQAGAGHRWTSFGRDPASLTPSLASPALSADHCLFTTLPGELVAVPLGASGRGLEGLTPQPFRFKTPHGKAVTSSPAIAGGRVYFGCDDGYLYVLAGGGRREPVKDGRALHRRRSRVTPAGERVYAWPSAFGGPRNASFVEDAGFRPPFRLRWAVRSGGLFKHPVCATEDDVIYVTLAGLVVCREQQTGRLRWRRKLDEQGWSRASLLCAGGRVFVPRTRSPRYPKIQDQKNALYCLDGDTGEILWERPIGIADRLRASPVLVDGVVAFGSRYLAPRNLQAVIPPHSVWQYLAGSDPPEQWTQPAFDAADWDQGVAGFGYGDGDDRTELDMAGNYRRVYLRRTFQRPQLGGAAELGLMVRYDDAFIAYLNGHEVIRAGVGRGSGPAASGIRLHEAQGFEYFPIPNGQKMVVPGVNVIALEGHNQSPTSSDFSLDPYLVAGTSDGVTGPVVDAWDAETGEPRWQIKIDGRGDSLEGPAGCAGDGIMFFTGGGSGEAGAGETLAVRPGTGQVLWRTPKAYASMNGTPAYQDRKVYLPGVYRLRMACLSAEDGSIVWEHDHRVDGRYRWFVDAPSLGPDYFTVNNKYQGGALRWNLADGRPVGWPDATVQLWGPGHGCGSVVLTSEGAALSATINGLSAIDSKTGRLLWKSPGFASYACPPPIVSNGRVFYCPQVSGTLYCFEPTGGD